MNCFYHQDRQAVGACKSCGKGLCPECAVDLGKGLACRGRCEEDVRALIQLIDHNIKLSPASSRLLQAGGSARIAGSLFFLACGLVFLIFGLSDNQRFSFAAVLGGCMIAYGLFTLWWAKRVSEPNEKPKA